MSIFLVFFFNLQEIVNLLENLKKHIFVGIILYNNTIYITIISVKYKKIAQI